MAEFLDFVHLPELYVLEYLDFRTIDKVRKLRDSECCTTSSEPFRFYTN
jgi:hypothetical protein